MIDSARIAGIYCYPVKSASAIAVEQATVEPRGLAGDRRWVVCDVQGEFLSGREVPALVRICAEQQSDHLIMNAPGMSELAVPIPDSTRSRQTVTVWNDRCDALPAGPEADGWLSTFLGVPCRLLHMDGQCVRPIGNSGKEVSFADNFPLLLISSASLDDLNARLPEPMDMRRFRPNLVVAGVEAYAEDEWQRIRIGEAEFVAVDRCDRCAMTVIDPDSAEMHPDQEPLRTLSRYRRGDDGGVYFGRNLIPERLGRVRTGDVVEIIA